MTAWLASVRLATTGNLAANGFGLILTPTTLDGVTVNLNDEILAKDQTNPIQNGTWIADATPGVAMARRADVFEPESTVRVSEGDKNAHTQFALKAPAGSITVGVDPLPWLRQDVKNYSFDTIAALKQFNDNVLENATASVAGFYAPGDDGGGDFTFVGVLADANITAATPVSVAVSTVTIDGTTGSVIVTTAAAHGLTVDETASVYLSGDLTPVGPTLAWVVDGTTLSLIGPVTGSAGAGAKAASYVQLTTAAAHGRVAGQRFSVSGVVASGGAADINQAWDPGGIIDTTNLTLPVEVPTPAGTYTAGASAVLGDDALRVTATDAAGTVGGIWDRTVKTPANVLWWGAVPNDAGATVNAAAFIAAITGAASNLGGGAVAGALVLVSPGNFTFTSILLILASCTLEGAHGGNGFGASFLTFKKNVGIQNSAGVGGAVFINGIVHQGQAHGTILRQLTILQGDGLLPEDFLNVTSGIYIAAGRVQLENLFVGSFQGDGILIDGTLAPCFLWGIGGHVAIEAAGRYGLYVRGQANVGTMSGTLDVRKGLSWGLVQSSDQFGNVYSGMIQSSTNGVIFFGGSWHNANPDETWPGVAPIPLGQRILPMSPTGYQYRARLVVGGGNPGVVEPVWPTTLGATVADGDITWECWMEEGGSVWGRSGGSVFNFIYQEGDQNPTRFVTGQDIVGLGGSIEAKSPIAFGPSGGTGGLRPFLVQSQRSEPFDGGNTACPVVLGMGGANGAGNLNAPMVDPLIGFWKFSGNGDVPGSFEGGIDILTDIWDKDRYRWFRQATAPGRAFGHYDFYSYTESDGRDGPQPGAVSWPTLFVGATLGNERRLTAVAAKTTAPYAPDFPALPSSAIGAFQANDLVWNIGAEGTTRVPLLWRVAPSSLSTNVAKGGQPHNNWAPNVGYEVGVVIAVSGIVGAPAPVLWRAKTFGFADPVAPPTWVDVPGTVLSDGPGTLTWEWWGYATDDSIFEPVIAELPTMGTFDVTTSGLATVTLSEDEAAHARLKLVGELSQDVDVIVPPGPALGWARDIWNATTNPVPPPVPAWTLTVKTTVGGTGVLLTQPSVTRLFADDMDVMQAT